jgi:hypothetical protein
MVVDIIASDLLDRKEIETHCRVQRQEIDKRSTLSVAALTAIVGYGYLTGYGDQA